MIKIGTHTTVADNTGATETKIIGTFGGTRRNVIRLGDIVKISIQAAKPMSGVKKGDKMRAVVVRVTKEQRRTDGTYVRFGDNSVVILEGNTMEPKGTRIFGPVARELKAFGFDKITYLAPEVL